LLFSRFCRGAIFAGLCGVLNERISAFVSFWNGFLFSHLSHSLSLSGRILARVRRNRHNAPMQAPCKRVFSFPLLHFPEFLLFSHSPPSRDLIWSPTGTFNCKSFWRLPQTPPPPPIRLNFWDLTGLYQTSHHSADPSAFSIPLAVIFLPSADVNGILRRTQRATPWRANWPPKNSPLLFAGENASLLENIRDFPPPSRQPDRYSGSVAFPLRRWFFSPPHFPSMSDFPPPFAPA